MTSHTNRTTGTLQDLHAATRDAGRPKGAATTPGGASGGNVIQSPIRDMIERRSQVIDGQTSRTHTPDQLAAMREVGLQMTPPLSVARKS